MSSTASELERAWQNHQAGNLRQAEAVYRQVLQKNPQHAAAWVYLGLAHYDQRRFDQAADAYRAAIRWQPQFPIAWNNLGNALRMMGALQEADECFGTALQQQPNYLSPLKNRGTLWVWNGDIDRGLEAYRQALALAPDDPELHRNLGIIYLLQQNYQQGWPEYRWRWRLNPAGRSRLPLPVWNGEDPAGKTFLLYPEQGLGDAIQFVRAAQTLQQAGASVVLQCAANLVPLLSSVPGIGCIVPDQLSPADLGIGRLDYQASLIDVVDFWYQRSGRLATDFLPIASGSAKNPAYLAVPDSLVDYWRRRLFSQPSGGRRRVGICWQGNPDFHADVYRSAPLETMRPLVDPAAIELYSLQFGFGTEQLAACSFADQVRQLPADIDRSAGAFWDTAAIIRNLDLVISVDTSTGHLAAALGTPVWLALAIVPDWRWTLTGSQTAWYPTMRLFRQQAQQQWSAVFQQMATEIRSAINLWLIG